MITEITKIHSLLFLVYSILMLGGLFIPLVARRRFKLSWVTIAFILLLNNALIAIVLLIDPASYSPQFDLMLLCICFEVLCCFGVNFMEKHEAVIQANIEAEKACYREFVALFRKEEDELLLEKRRIKKDNTEE